MKELHGVYKVCPLCHTKNEATALHCSNCFYDLSRVAITQEEQSSLKLIGEKFAILILKESIIGRETTGKEYLNNRAVSRKHLKIFWKEHLPYAEDLESANGTYLNHQKMIPMQEYALKNNDTITLANKFEFIVRTQNIEEVTCQEVVAEDATYREKSGESSEQTVIQSASSMQQWMLEEGGEINGYKIKSHLASGGESDTYLVTKEGSEYVLKFYRKDAKPNVELVKNIQKITQEYRENFVMLVEFWQEKNKYYEIYEFCPHGNLANFIKSEKNESHFNEKEVLFHFVATINNGLKILHKNGILHRDLKPSNILVREDFTLVLSDFGIAKGIESSTVYTKNFKGSYKYSAPETLSNQFNKKSDYWSLGVILYELYFHENPFEKMNVNAVFSQLLSDAPFPTLDKEVDAQLLVLLQGLLYKEPLKRWGSEEVDNFLKNIQTTTDDASLTNEEKGEGWQEYGFNEEDANYLSSFNIDAKEAKYAQEQGLTLHEMKILKTEVRCLIQNTKAHYGAVNAVAYAPKEALLASGGKDYKLKLWDANASQSYATLEHHTDYIEAIAFSPDGTMIATGSRDKTIKLWSVHKKEYIATLSGHQSCVGAITFSPDGSLLASGGWDTTVHIWDVAKRVVLESYHDNLSYVRSIAWSSHGKYIATGSEDGTIYIWEREKKELLSKIDSSYPCISFVSFHPSKEDLLAYSGVKGYIFVWSITKKNIVAVLENKIEKTSLHFSKRGDMLASGGADGSILLWNINDVDEHTLLRKNVEELYLQDGSVSAIKKGEQIEIWDKSQRKKTSTIRLTSSAINAVAFSSHNRFLACGVSDGFLQIWDSSLQTTIETIMQNSFTIREYFLWLEKGYGVKEAKNWKERGFDVTEASRWERSGFLPQEAKEWSSNHFLLEDAIAWKNLNFLPYDAVEWVGEGLTIKELHHWMDADFTFAEAREWIENDFTIQEAIKWRDDTIAPQKAKKYRKFGIIGHFLAKFF